jgi:hypothetical protein
MATKAKATPSKKANGKNKTQAVAALMRRPKRPKGMTREEVLALTQWPSVSLQAVANAAGVKLRVDNKERPYRYHAA